MVSIILINLLLCVRTPLDLDTVHIESVTSNKSYIRNVFFKYQTWVHIWIKMLWQLRYFPNLCVLKSPLENYWISATSYYYLIGYWTLAQVIFLHDDDCPKKLCCTKELQRLQYENCLENNCRCLAVRKLYHLKNMNILRFIQMSHQLLAKNLYFFRKITIFFVF